jgi:hypothetical protein
VSQRKEKVCCNVSYKNKIYNNTNRYMTYICGSHHILTIILVNKNFDDDNDYNNLILSEVEDLHLLLMLAFYLYFSICRLNDWKTAKMDSHYNDFFMIFWISNSYELLSIELLTWHVSHYLYMHWLGQNRWRAKCQPFAKGDKIRAKIAILKVKRPKSQVYIS